MFLGAAKLPVIIHRILLTKVIMYRFVRQFRHLDLGLHPPAAARSCRSYYCSWLSSKDTAQIKRGVGSANVTEVNCAIDSCFDQDGIPRKRWILSEPATYKEIPEFGTMHHKKRYWYKSDDDEDFKREVIRVIVGPDADLDIEMPGIKCVPVGEQFTIERMVKTKKILHSVYDMIEIFSVSCHWDRTKGENFYHIYGNLFLKDMDGVYQRAVQRSSKESLTVCNGGTIPLNLKRSLTTDIPCSFLSVCLKGHGSGKGNCYGNCAANSEVLIKKGICFNRCYDLDCLLEEVITSDDCRLQLKIHFAITMYPFFVELRAILLPNSYLPISKETASEVKNQLLCIDGSLTVRWSMFEDEYERLGLERDHYKITLFDTKQGASPSNLGDSHFILGAGKPIPLLRRFLTVPHDDDGITSRLLFEADIQIAGGDRIADTIEASFDIGNNGVYTHQIQGSGHTLIMTLVPLST